MLKMLAGQFPPRRCRDEATIQSTANFGNPISGGSPIFSIFFHLQRTVAGGSPLVRTYVTLLPEP